MGKKKGARKNLDDNIMSILQSADTVSGDKDRFTRGSRWATDREFSDSLKTVDAKSRTEGGVVLWSDGNRMLVDTEDNHTIVFGSTGSKKTSMIVSPSIMSLGAQGHSMIVSDPKGELQEQTRGHLESLGYKVMVLNCRDPLSSDCWNPLAIPYRLYRCRKAVEKAWGYTMVYDLANSICPVLSVKDPYWETAAASLIAGAIFMLFDLASDESEVNLNGVQEIIGKVAEDDEELTAYLNNLKPGSQIYNCMSGAVFNANTTKLCITASARAALRPYTSQPIISDLLSNNDIEMRDIGSEKAVVYLTIPDDRSTYNALVCCFVKQSYSILIDEADRNDGKKLKVNTHYILDEFANFPCLPDVGSMVSAGRSRGIRFMFVLQGMDQLISRYGVETANTIIGNCSNIVFINSREEKLLRFISTLVGADSDNRPLMTIPSLQRFDKERGEFLVLHDRNYPYISHAVHINQYGLQRSSSKEDVRERRGTHILSFSDAIARSKEEQPMSDVCMDFLMQLEAEGGE